MTRRIALFIAVAAVAAIAILLAVADLDGPSETGRDSAPAQALSTGEIELRYASEYPAVAYSTRPVTGRVGRLAESVASGATRIEFDPRRGYLDGLLRALEIDPSSQLLVFSKTSVQVGGIGPGTPRAIYFNDDTYVAWVQGAPTIEVASMDPRLGPVFHRVSQTRADGGSFDRELGRCLRCHDSYSLTGGGVPRFILGSGYIGTDGELVSHEAWILTSPSTPLRSRWGGWYVSGRHGDQVHLGNIVVENAADLQDLESLRVGNLDDLSSLLDTEPYPTEYSDIVALLVIEHQVHVQNAISRVLFDATTLLDDAEPGTDLDAGVAEIAEPLVRALFMVDEISFDDEIRGTSSFSASFEARGPHDTNGRSLRELDLQERLFRYPLSYLVYSEAFDGLPDEAREYVVGRIADVLSGRDDSADFAHVSKDDRRAIVEILRETRPGLVESLAPRAVAQTN